MILIIKYFMLFLLLVACTLIGRFLSKKYVYRLNELEEIKNGLNIFESKIKFTYDPIPEIFEEISKRLSLNVSNIFITAKEKMKEISASKAWEDAIDETGCNFSKEDKKENLLSSWLLNDKYQKIKANINISKNKVKLKQILE